MLRLLICALLSLPIVGQNKPCCYSERTNFYFQFGTHTAYEDVYPKNVTAVSLPNCEPVQFWITLRHGSRNPCNTTLSNMKVLKNLRDVIIDNHERGNRGNLCSKDLENLKNWNVSIEDVIPMELTPQGYDDLRNLAQRYKARFPSLLDQPYNEDMFQFRTTDTQRTIASGNAFVEGLFGPDNNVKFAEHESPDLLLKAYDNCTAWIQNAQKAAKYADEYNNGTQMTTVRKNVGKRLGFNSMLCAGNVIAMYEACSFEHAWHPNETSPWCAVFDDEELKILEYRNDLRHYHTNGYLNDINIRLSSLLIKDLLDHFSAKEMCGKQPTGVFYFTHSDMLQQLMLNFDVGKDKYHLTQCNYKQMENRKWRTSKLTPFAANLAAVFFRCDEGEPYQVLFYLNEQPMDIEGCENGLCDWYMLKNKLGTIVKDSTLDFCEM